MSSSINLNLDFHDYAPQNTLETGDKPPSSYSGQNQPRVVIKIPEDPSGSKASSEQNRIDGLLDSLTNFQAINITDETVKRILSATKRHKRQQQRTDNSLAGNWGLSYFAQYFDITTDDVVERILWSAIPLRKVDATRETFCESELIAPLAATDGGLMDDRIDNDMSNSAKKSYSYVERFIQSRPDLYGPFWISTTLIITIAMFSNIASFFNFKSHLEQSAMIDNGTSNRTAETAGMEIDQNMDAWHYSMEELNLATSLVMMYTTVLPTILWFSFWFRGCTKYYTLIETVCAYGYSLSIFIPCSALLMIQAVLFRYVALTISWLLSGLVLLFSFLPIVKSDPSPTGSHILLILLMICHFGLAYGLHSIMLQ